MGIFILVAIFYCFSCQQGSANYQEPLDTDQGKKITLDLLVDKFARSKEPLTLEQVFGEFAQSINAAKTSDELRVRKAALEAFKQELFASPQALFDKFCPGARVLTAVIFPSFNPVKVELFVNYIIDRSNESLSFYFGKKASDLDVFQIDVLLRELLIFIQYFEGRQGLGTKCDTYKRLKAFRLDYLFFKVYVVALKGNLKYSERALVNGLIKDIKAHIQSLVKTKYEHYYRKRLEMLELVTNKVLGGQCY